MEEGTLASMPCWNCMHAAPMRATHPAWVLAHRATKNLLPAAVALFVRAIVHMIQLRSNISPVSIACCHQNQRVACAAVAGVSIATLSGVSCPVLAVAAAPTLQRAHLAQQPLPACAPRNVGRQHLGGRPHHVEYLQSQHCYAQ
jgi:hypothetical protein